jgi:uncharacterized protein
MKIILTLLMFVFFLPVLKAQNEMEVKMGDTTIVIKKYFMGFLKVGPNRTHDSLTTAKIQEGHLKHLSKLGNDGIISIAGPFAGDGDLRGIVIFNTATKEEAEKYESEDPAIKSGRLIMEVKEWWSMKGAVLK